MAVGVVVQLGGLEDQAIRSEGLIDALEFTPFVLVRAKAKNLKLDDCLRLFDVV